jgi:bacteriorhodopsin
MADTFRVITTPLLLMDILLTAGLPWPTIFFTILCDEIMIITGLVGALVESNYKWGYFAFGCAAMFMVFWNIVFVAQKHATIIGADVKKVFIMVSYLTILLW